MSRLRARMSDPFFPVLLGKSHGASLDVSLANDFERFSAIAMLALEDKLKLVDWPKALIGMVVTTLLALSVHVVMLQVLNVPYPTGYPKAGWAVFGQVALSVLGLMVFYRLAIFEFARFSVVIRCLTLFLLVAMLREALIRGPVMDGFATTAWVFSIVSSLPRLITILIISCLVVVTEPWVARPWQVLLTAIAIAALIQFLCAPLIGAAFSHILDSISYLSHDEVYKAPYGWQIEVPAYITYLEPVAACFVMAAVVWERLSRNMVLRTVQFVLLVLAMNTILIRPIVYVFYAPFGASTALLSMGQFFLEALALALLTVCNWRFSQRRHS
jgi:hypothetical protein